MNESVGRTVSRRTALRIGAVALDSPLWSACLGGPTAPSGAPFQGARLVSRPGEPAEERTEGVIVADLLDAGCLVEYVPFDGGHEVPGEIATQALDWWLT